MVPLKSIIPAATNTVNTQFILLEKGSPTQDGNATTCLALVADETASVHFQMWGSECEVFEPGHIIRLSNGIFSYHKNNLVLRAGKKGKAEKVGEFTMLFVETPNMSEIHWGRDPNDPKKFVQVLQFCFTVIASDRLLSGFAVSDVRLSCCIMENVDADVGALRSICVRLI